MTRGTLQCVTCGQAGHVSASCPQGRTWWQRLRDVLVMRDPFDVTAFQDSEPQGQWPEITEPGKLERRR